MPFLVSKIYMALLSRSEAFCASETDDGFPPNDLGRYNKQMTDSHLTPLKPQSRFGDKPLKFQVVCPQKRDCGPKRVKAKFSRPAVRYNFIRVLIMYRGVRQRSILYVVVVDVYLLLVPPDRLGCCCGASPITLCHVCVSTAGYPRYNWYYVQ